ncbi:LysE/ArgO family amino acid transporter [Sulfitobacter guttiformis]|uniref:L-lysine exporter family protein LysE/ArgO n=1 Tax=Sulfitobacter guttiformis TaxID=74349 RepID=A0A420DK41_9RHOB|nr:L-lysine exporter [Sulfitobacter guttiformis KCTC 32187]RKE94555.1 L-lysine exporter family protein LysE/ArgO [Sulfitobacter guttiformis]
MMSSFVPGFLLSLSLILAIGAQNAFVLRQGVRREHVFWVCLTCAITDALLISAGVAGFGALAVAVPWFETAMRFGGAAFLFVYGTRAAISALQGGAVLEPAGENGQSLKRTILTLLAITFLNPHVYLDTLVLVGSISAQYPDRVAFAAGAISASAIFFFILGYGARLLQPVFARPVSWRILDGLIAVTMWAISAALLLG